MAPFLYCSCSIKTNLSFDIETTGTLFVCYLFCNMTFLSKIHTSKSSISFCHCKANKFIQQLICASSELKFPLTSSLKQHQEKRTVSFILQPTKQHLKSKETAHRLLNLILLFFFTTKRYIKRSPPTHPGIIGLCTQVHRLVTSAPASPQQLVSRSSPQHFSLKARSVVWRTVAFVEESLLLHLYHTSQPTTPVQPPCARLSFCVPTLVLYVTMMVFCYATFKVLSISLERLSGCYSYSFFSSTFVPTIACGASPHKYI